MTSTRENDRGTLQIRNADERGAVDLGWLKSRHSFSFGHYHDPAHMGFRALRVINDDRVEAGQGFGTHPHRDMEIISYVIEGALEHKDSLGNGSVIQSGDVQVMSAGTGVRHSEFNPSDQEATHFLQVWILPRQEGLPPSYQQQRFTREDKLNQLRLVASPDGRDGSLTVHQDVNLYAAVLEPGQSVRHTAHPDRYLWAQVVAGELTANGTPLRTGDGAAISEAGTVELVAATESELLLFDLA